MESLETKYRALAELIVETHHHLLLCGNKTCTLSTLPPKTDRHRRVFNKNLAGNKTPTGARRRRFVCIKCRKTHSVEAIAKNGIAQIIKLAPHGLAQLRVNFSELVDEVMARLPPPPAPAPPPPPPPPPPPAPAPAPA